jgi:hypothetical protein
MESAVPLGLGDSQALRGQGGDVTRNDFRLAAWMHPQQRVSVRGLQSPGLGILVRGGASTSRLRPLKPVLIVI